MVRLKQVGSTTCGQTCVAMVVGATEIEVCTDALGHCSGTSTKDLQRALEYYGVTYEKRLRPATKSDPLFKRFPRCIIAMKVKQGGTELWHWVLRWDGEIIDPSGWWPGCEAGSRLTSALVLTGRPGLEW